MHGPPIDLGQQAEQLLDLGVELDASGAEQAEQPPGTAFGKALQRRPFGIGGWRGSGDGKRLHGSGARILAAERLQGEGAGARADGRYEAPRRRGDEQEHRARRRLLQRLEQGIRSVDVQLVGFVDDDDAPAVSGGAVGKERTQPANLVDRDRGGKALRLHVVGTADEQQPGVRQRLHLACGARRFGDREALPRRIALALRRQRGAREAVGERRLADALRPGQQPGMVQAPAGQRLSQQALGLGVAVQLLRLARMRVTLEPVGLRQFLELGDGGCARHYRGGASRRDCTACHTAAKTARSSCAASMMTQRSGSARAMSRKASRSFQWKARSRFS